MADNKTLKDELLKRLPEGTVLPDDLLEKLSGGLTPFGLADGRYLDSSENKLFPIGLADDLAMPAKFASLAELEKWLANRAEIRNLKDKCGGNERPRHT